MSSRRFTTAIHDGFEAVGLTSPSYFPRLSYWCKWRGTTSILITLVEVTWEHDCKPLVRQGFPSHSNRRCTTGDSVTIWGRKTRLYQRVVDCTKCAVRNEVEAEDWSYEANDSPAGRSLVKPLAHFVNRSHLVSKDKRGYSCTSANARSLNYWNGLLYVGLLNKTV